MKKVLLYSGGFDSVALLDIILKNESTTDLTVLFERTREIQSELEEKMARKTYRILVKKYKREGLDVKWITKNINLQWIAEDHRSQGGDILLSLHLMSALIECPYDIIYTGWHKNNLKHLSFARSIIKWFKSMKQDKIELYFMEDIIHGESPESCKVKTIEYLLEANLFHLPYSSESWQSEKEYKNRKNKRNL